MKCLGVHNERFGRKKKLVLYHANKQHTQSLVLVILTSKTLLYRYSSCKIWHFVFSCFSFHVVVLDSVFKHLPLQCWGSYWAATVPNFPQILSFPRNPGGRSPGVPAYSPRISRNLPARICVKPGEFRIVRLQSYGLKRRQALCIFLESATVCI